jgi:hypothetical protein
VYYAPPLPVTVAAAAVELELAGHHLRGPYVSRYAVGLNGRPFATLRADYDRREVEFILASVDHPVFGPDGPEFLAGLSEIIPEPDRPYRVLNRDDALPYLGSGLRVLFGGLGALYESSSRGFEDGPISDGTEGLVALMTQLVVGPSQRL